MNRCIISNKEFNFMNLVSTNPCGLVLRALFSSACFSSDLYMYVKINETCRYPSLVKFYLIAKNWFFHISNHQIMETHGDWLYIHIFRMISVQDYWLQFYKNFERNEILFWRIRLVIEVILKCENDAERKKYDIEQK